MNNKGFTFIELLVTLLVISLIALISIPSINGINKSIRNRQRENIIKRLELAAEKYAYDTGQTVIFVDTLVTEGYVNADNNVGEVIDPTNNSSLNCYAVKVDLVNDVYVGKFVDYNYTTNNGCDSSKLDDDVSTISIGAKVNNTVVNTANWQKGTVHLYVTGMSIDCTTSECKWVSKSGANYSGNTEIDVTGTVINTTYTFSVLVTNDSGVNKVYRKSIGVKIDNQAPVFDAAKTNKLPDPNNASKYRVVLVTNDGAGSGVDKYYFGTSSSCSGVTYQSSNVFNNLSSGTYKVCIKDVAGNVGEGTFTV